MLTNTMLKKRLRVFENIKTEDEKDNKMFKNFNFDFARAESKLYNMYELSDQLKTLDESDDLQKEESDFNLNFSSGSSNTSEEKESAEKEEEPLYFSFPNKFSEKSPLDLEIQNFSSNLCSNIKYFNDFNEPLSNTLLISFPMLKMMTEFDLCTFFGFYGEIEQMTLLKFNEVSVKYYDLRSSYKAFNEISYNFEKLLNNFEKDKFSISFLSNKNEVFEKFYLNLQFSENVKDFTQIVRFIEMNAEIEKIISLDGKFSSLLLKFYNSKEKVIADYLVKGVSVEKSSEKNQNSEKSQENSIIFSKNTLMQAIIVAERNTKEESPKAQKNKNFQNFLNPITPITPITPCSNNSVTTPQNKSQALKDFLSTTSKTTKNEKIPQTITPFSAIKKNQPPILPPSKTTTNYNLSNKENKNPFYNSRHFSKNPNPYKIVYDQKYEGIKKRNTPDDERKKYIINIDNILNDWDSRTTLMIKNIPTYITQVELLKIINRKFSTAFNFFYLPIDFNKKLNAGYAFINFKNSKLIVDFFREFDNKPWDLPGCKNKIGYLSYARIQGFRTICEHFQKSSIMKQVDEKVKPIIFMD